jgi:hypothetical protein
LSKIQIVYNQEFILFEHNEEEVKKELKNILNHTSYLLIDNECIRIIPALLTLVGVDDALVVR